MQSVQNTNAVIPRWQFSLTQLFVALTIAALALSCALVSVRLQDERASHRRKLVELNTDLEKREREVERALQQHRLALESARRAAGLPIVNDPRSVAAGGMWLDRLNTWRFTVYKPAGRKLVLAYAFQGITGNEGTCGSTLPQAAGRCAVLFPTSQGKDVAETHLDLHLEVERGEVTLRVDGVADWVQCNFPRTNPLYRSRMPSDAFETVLFNHNYRDCFALVPTQELPLILLRVYDTDSSSGEGLIVWLEDATAEVRIEQ